MSPNSNFHQLSVNFISHLLYRNFHQGLVDFLDSSSKWTSCSSAVDLAGECQNGFHMIQSQLLCSSFMLINFHIFKFDVQDFGLGMTLQVLRSFS